MRGTCVPAPGTALTPGDQAPAAEAALQLADVLREPLGGGRVTRTVRRSVPGARPTPRSMRPGWSSARGAELLGHDQWGVVGRHGAAGAQPDGAGVRGDVGDEHRRGRGGDRGHVVVLRGPDPPVAQAFRVLGEPDGAGEALAHGGAPAAVAKSTTESGRGAAGPSRGGGAPRLLPSVRSSPAPGTRRSRRRGPCRRHPLRSAP